MIGSLRGLHTFLALTVSIPLLCSLLKIKVWLELYLHIKIDPFPDEKNGSCSQLTFLFGVGGI